MRPFFRNPVSSTASTAAGIAHRPHDVPRQGVPGTRPRPTARSSAAAASRPATRPRRTPPAARSSSAPRCDSSPSRYARPCRRTRAFEKAPATCANISLNDSDHAACPSRASPARHPRQPACRKPGPPGGSDHAATPHKVTARCCSTRMECDLARLLYRQPELEQG